MIATESNVDPSEIEHFDRLAQDWWDPQGPMRPLHQLNPIRLQYIQDKVSLNAKKVLDVGCGGGLLSEALAQAGAQVTGLDMSEALIQCAQMHASQNALNITYQQQRIEDFSQQTSERFDVITCMEMLEHVPDPAQILAHCQSLLKPKGLLICSTLNRHLKAYLISIIGAEYLLQLLPKGTHDYQQFIRPSELCRMARQCRLSEQHLQGISYHPLKQQFSLSNDLSVNYLACFQAP
jgi:2-polyprenyl-6-hydroxyphenyl methylase/3-demethylubiquinone-9 3-methyltransferase